MGAHIRAIGHLDTFALLASLYERRSEFDTITLRQDTPGSPHRDTRAIFLRGPDEPTVTRWFEDVPHVDYPAWRTWPEAEPLFTNLLTSLPQPIPDVGKVMLVELKPGGALAWHVDEGAYAVQHERYHLALTTNPGAWLLSGGEQAHVPVGALVWFDNHALHSAINVGPTPRIHLIVDIRRG